MIPGALQMSEGKPCQQISLAPIEGILPADLVQEGFTEREA